MSILNKGLGHEKHMLHLTVTFDYSEFFDQVSSQKFTSYASFNSHHIPGSTTQMVPPMINPTSPPTTRILKNSKQLHTQGSPINTQGDLGQFPCHST
jgi:hypothetical protein